MKLRYMLDILGFEDVSKCFQHNENHYFEETTTHSKTKISFCLHVVSIKQTGAREQGAIIPEIFLL